MNPRMLPGESDAAFCRRMGYGPGTRLVGDEGNGVTIIRLTAVGERVILAVMESHAGERCDNFEHTWTLGRCDWRPV